MIPSSIAFVLILASKILCSWLGFSNNSQFMMALMSKRADPPPQRRKERGTRRTRNAAALLQHGKNKQLGGFNNCFLRLRDRWRQDHVLRNCYKQLLQLGYEKRSLGDVPGCSLT